MKSEDRNKELGGHSILLAISSSFVSNDSTGHIISSDPFEIINVRYNTGKNVALRMTDQFQQRRQQIGTELGKLERQVCAIDHFGSIGSIHSALTKLPSTHHCRFTIKRRITSQPSTLALEQCSRYVLHTT